MFGVRFFLNNIIFPFYRCHQMKNGGQCRGKIGHKTIPLFICMLKRKHLLCPNSIAILAPTVSVSVSVGECINMLLPVSN